MTVFHRLSGLAVSDFPADSPKKPDFLPLFSNFSEFHPNAITQSAIKQDNVKIMLKLLN